MENDGGNVAGAGVCVPPEGVVQCEGIPRKSWMTKCVALQMMQESLLAKEFAIM